MEKKSSNSRQDAIRGCLLAGAIGDALGAPAEFLSRNQICQKFGKDGITKYVEFDDGGGAITDDTQMTLFTAEGILCSYASFVETGKANSMNLTRLSYFRWLDMQKGKVPKFVADSDLKAGWLSQQDALRKHRAPGMTCMYSLEEAEPKVATALNDSKGCGTVMRMAPVGLFFPPEKAYSFGCKASALTHGHPTGYTAGGAFAMLIAELLAGCPLTEAVNRVIEYLKKQPGAEETLAALQGALAAESISELGEGWIAEEALAIGVYCALKHPDDVHKAICLAVNITGDSDSTGAITGNIVGVLCGESKIPRPLIEKLCEREIVEQVADDLFKRIEQDTDGHVTDAWKQKYPFA